MRRTGDSACRLTGSGAALLSCALLSSSALADDIEFYQTVDRDEVGTEDTLRLTVIVSGAPDTAQVQLPAPQDFEVLSRSQSTQMSVQIAGGGTSIKRVTRYTLVLRANRTGTLTIPPAVLTTADKTYKTEAIRVEVRRGRLRQNAPPQQQLPDPFAAFPFPVPDPFGDLPEEDFFEPDIPRSDSDLFIRSYVDREEVYVGEQTTLSVYIYSRVDLSSVDAVTMPKLDGFWSEDLDSPTQLSAEQKVIGGVPYRAYLLKRRALFPVKPGKLPIAAAEADITTGFLFAGRRVHRKGNALEVSVKPLPPGAPAGFSPGNVGQWRLSVEATPTEVALGNPVTVKVILEGRGNLKNVSLPALSGPPGLRIYEPTTTDKLASARGRLGGRRVQEYLVMPQKTGTFTLPGLTLVYFDPEGGRYETSKADPITLTVQPSTSGQNAISLSPGTAAADEVARNKLEATGLKPLRHKASFEPARAPVWSRPYFLPITLAPVALWLGSAAFSLLRSSLGKQDEAARKKKQARMAYARLAAAEKLKASGAADAFYGEIEKALYEWLEARLGEPVAGLTRDRLGEKLVAAGIAEERRTKILSVLEQCEAGRYAPGGGDAVRGQVLNEAASAMEG